MAQLRETLFSRRPFYFPVLRDGVPGDAPRASMAKQAPRRWPRDAGDRRDAPAGPAASWFVCRRCGTARYLGARASPGARTCACPVLRTRPGMELDRVAVSLHFLATLPVPAAAEGATLADFVARRAAADREETALLRRHVATRCPPSRGSTEVGACPVTNASGATPPARLTYPRGRRRCSSPRSCRTAARQRARAR